MNSTNSSRPFNKWDLPGVPWLTTPEDRLGRGPPYTSTALQVNLFFRVFLGIVSLFVTWVPARLLWRNGEFGGTVFCVMLLILNFMTVVNALIWRNDNVETWWKGDAWCDFQAYTFFALHSAFNISLFEIMRGLASKVALNRAVTPTRSERRRQRIVSALVIFTIPVLQVVLTYFATFGRYNVSTLVGCNAMYYPGWIYLVFYIIPTPVFAVAAAIMAAVTFYRYRKIERVTRDVSRSQDGIAAARQERVRKKLYFMTLACIILVLPLVMILLFRNIVEGAPWSLPYDFEALHFGPDPYNIYFISFTTSDLMSFSALAIAFIGELAGIAVFIPFGTTPEALNMYREMLLTVGLGYIFPKLKEEYVPRPKRSSRFSWGSLIHPLRGKSVLGSNSTTSTRKDSLLPTAEQVSVTSRADRARSCSMTQPQPKDFTMSGTEPISYPEKTVAATTSTPTNPWPDLDTTDIDVATAQITSPPSGPAARNPFTLLPTPFAKPPPRLPALSIPYKKSPPTAATAGTTTDNDASTPSLTTASSSSLRSGAQTQPHPQSTTAATTTTTTTTTTSKQHPLAPWTRPTPTITSTTAIPYEPAPRNPTIGVDTRVWADANTTNPNKNNPNNPNKNSDDGNDTNSTRRTNPRKTPGPRPNSGGAGWESDLEAGTSGGVRVETSIARRSMDLEGEEENGPRVRVGRFSSTAS